MFASADRVLARVAAEIVGTFILVAGGTAAVAGSPDPAVATLVVAVAFTLSVSVAIVVSADGSGAHLNPAVSIAFVVAGHLPRRLLWPYLVAQFIGASLASLAVRAAFGGDAALGVTRPSGVSAAQAFAIEAALTLVLMAVIITVVSRPEGSLILIATAIGLTVGLAALTMGPLTGASLNPARSFGPALVGVDFEWLWLYLAAPVVGALLALPLVRLWSTATGGP